MTYLGLIGAVACGPKTSGKEPTVFRIDTDECRITQAETPFLDIEIRYGNLWNARGRYNSATENVTGVTANPKFYNPGLPYERMIEHAQDRLVGCAKEDPLRQKRPVGFVLDESSLRRH